MIHVIRHYDLLIDEGNDPFHDPPALKQYMDQWDGRKFIEALNLSPGKNVLEIGMGTGRIAARVAPCCLHLTGIDISPKTIRQARENLKAYPNVDFVCDDFLHHRFTQTFDIVYSSLTMMHFEDKRQVIEKVDRLLNTGGIFCLSIDKNQDPFIDMGSRKIRIYPDTPEEIVRLVGESSMRVAKVIETDHAHILVCEK